VCGGDGAAGAPRGQELQNNMHYNSNTLSRYNGRKKQLIKKDNKRLPTRNVMTHSIPRESINMNRKQGNSGKVGVVIHLYMNK
jgi:hypothetical protein